MSFRGTLALGLLLAAAGAERLASYSVRSFIALDMSRSDGMTAASIGMAFTAMSIGPSRARARLRARARGLVHREDGRVHDRRPARITALRAPLLVVGGLVCVAAGGATTVLGRSLHRTWFDPPNA